MNRRDFLKTVTQTSLTALAFVAPPQLRGSTRSASPVDIRTVASSKKLLGTLDGRIFESLDSGKTWQPRANFGRQCSILDIYERNGKIYARVGIQGHDFLVESRDGRVWYTLNWAPRKA